MAVRPKSLGITTEPTGTWIQVDRGALERWSKLATANPRAASVMLAMTSQMGRHNALVTSQANLARISGCSVATLKRALTVLREQNWIDVRQIGPTGTACAYVVNDQVAWSGKRDGIRYSLFSAAVLLSDDEQPERDALDAQPPLEKIPVMHHGEKQLPTGLGLPPPADPAIPGLELDLPSRKA